MAAKTHYTFRNMQGVPGAYHVIKFDKDFEYVETYALGTYNGRPTACSCFAGNKWCRHKQMFQLFEELKRIDSGWFYQFDTKTWTPPIDPLKQGEAKTTDD